MRTISINPATYDPKTPILGAGSGVAGVFLEPVGCGLVVALSDAPFVARMQGTLGPLVLAAPEGASFFVVLSEGDSSSIPTTPGTRLYAGLFGDGLPYRIGESRAVLSLLSRGEVRTNSPQIGDGLIGRVRSLVNTGGLTPSDSYVTSPLITSNDCRETHYPIGFRAILTGGISRSTVRVCELVLRRYTFAWVEESWLFPGDGMCEIVAPISTVRGDGIAWELGIKLPSGAVGAHNAKVELDVIRGIVAPRERYWLDFNNWDGVTNTVLLGHTNKRGAELVGVQKHATVGIVATTQSVKPTYLTKGEYSNQLFGEAIAYPGNSVAGVEMAFNGSGLARKTVHQLSTFTISTASVGYISAHRGV